MSEESQQPNALSGETPAGKTAAQIKRHLTVAWIATAFTLATYFLLMISVAVTPSFLAQTIAPSGALTLGIVGGVLIILILIGVATAFTIWNNKMDSDA
jgi:uncharacterized membrane protein (DUF485 family)